MHPYGGDEFELPSLDFVGDERELRALALRDLEAVGGRNYRTPAYEEAGDATNAIRVTVDKAGLVKDVHVARDWRQQLSLHAFGHALLEAYQNARRAMMNAVALGELAEEERDGRRGEDWPDEPPAVPYVPERDIGEIWRMLSEIEDIMYRTEKLERQAGGESVRTVSSPYGYLTGRCQGRSLLSIAAELTLIQQAGPEQLRSEAVELLRQVESLTHKENT
jgi:hypothetical protein